MLTSIIDSKEIRPQAVTQELVSTIDAPDPSSAVSAFTWPEWARTARIAGAYFVPDESDAVIEARLDALVAQNVSVVLADSPWGSQFAVWVEDEKFGLVKDLIAKVVEKAHARGLKVVLYQTGLELLSEPARNPGLEYPHWAQVAIDGTPVLYNDIDNGQEHWLNEGVWDIWLTPCGQATADSDSFRKLSFSRVRDMVATGIDGLWVDTVYLQGSVGSHEELWASSDPCSAAAFKEATDLTMPTEVDWDDPTFQRWVIWRHTQITDFLLAEKEVARAVNPSLVFLNENAGVDTGWPTYIGNDPASLLDYPDISTGHEIGTVADRIDEGDTGMQGASLDEWLAFRTMVAFARGTDRGKPSWILTYGYQPRDSAQLAGLVLAEGANFYETKGPQMADSVGAAFRKQLFAWIADHERDLYGGDAVAQVGLLFSPRNRDLLDTTSGEAYDVADSVHFAAYRSVANMLYRAHIPFDVVIDTDIDAFARYTVLIAPELQLMSDTTATALHEFAGKIIAVGSVGVYDEWLNLRPSLALSGTSAIYLPEVSQNIVKGADTGLLATSAPPTVQIGLRRNSERYSLVLVNTGSVPTAQLSIELRASSGDNKMNARLYRLDGQTIDVPIQVQEEQGTIQLTVPPGIDTLALLILDLNEEVKPRRDVWLPQMLH